MLFVEFFLFSLFYIAGINAFIVVPEELPSILSVLYSNVPPVKKGTDSRVGIGFRLGPNADFQVQLELGPQTNTQPIGPNASTNNTSKKRHTLSTKTNNYNATNPSEKWLNMWKLNLEDEEGQTLQELEHKGDPTKENYTFVHQLRQLYESANKTSE